MRTLHIGLRVANLNESLRFYEALGYEVLGEVPETSFGRLTMLKLPGDEFVTIELVYDPDAEPPSGRSTINHLVIQVESLETTVTELAKKGIHADAQGQPASPGGEDGPQTDWITDPDGNRIELVEWPTGHPEGMSAADFQQGVERDK